jgi:hypothetical protein
VHLEKLGIGSVDVFSKTLRLFAEVWLVAAASPTGGTAALRIKANSVTDLKFIDAVANRSDYTGPIAAENPRQAQSLSCDSVTNLDVGQIDGSRFEANDDIIG